MHKSWFAAGLALLLMLGAGCRAEVKDIAKSCRFWVNKGSKAEITDTSMGTAWTPGGDAEMRVMLPDEGAAWIQINWSRPPEDYTLTEYDANQTEISSRTATEEENFGCISQLIPVSQGARYISVKFNQKGQGINKVRVYPEGELPPTAVQWEKPHDKCDLLVVSTHEDDEWLWFGAMIPYYDLVKDKDVQVVYMANCGRLRYGEALNSIAVSGVKTYPYFVGLKDQYDDSLAAAVRTWKSKEYIIGVMAEVIRRFKPEVILTHDWNGEYGHPQHKLTSRCMEYAIEAAADPNQYPESYEKYGAWQVKKLYRHLEKKGRIEFDWHVAYDEFGGKTGLEVATASMNEHASQLKWYHVEDHGKYDNSLFGLSWSAVGDDVLHEDLFENVPETTPTPEPSPTPEPTLEPTPEPSEAPDELAGGFAGGEEEIFPGDSDESADEWDVGEPMDTSLDGWTGSADELDGEEASEFAPEGSSELEPELAPGITAPPEVEAGEERGGSAAPIAIGIGVAVAASGGLGYALYARQQKLRRSRRKHRGAKKGSAKKAGAKESGTKKAGTKKTGTKKAGAGRSTKAQHAKKNP